MTQLTPVACLLGAGDLKQRLAAIAEVRANGLIADDIEEGRHQLRFRADATTRGRLQGIVAAESECCAFLDLSLREIGDELVLSITPPENAQAVADDLAGAFTGLLHDRRTTSA